GAKQRPAFQLAREPLQLLRGAGSDPEVFPGEVAVPGMAGLERALTGGEPVQRLAQGDVERAGTPREHRKQLVQHARKLGAGARVALAGQRPVDERGNGCQRLEPRVERATTVEEGFRHEKTLADPSDITGPRRVRSLSGTRLETGRSAPSAMGLPVAMTRIPSLSRAASADAMSRGSCPYRSILRREPIDHDSRWRGPEFRL